MTDGICTHDSSAGGEGDEDRSICKKAGTCTDDDAREPAGLTISQGTEDCTSAATASSMETKSRDGQSRKIDGSDKRVEGRDERRKNEGEEARRGGVLTAAEGEAAAAEGGKANASPAADSDAVAAAAAASQTPVKRKKKEKTVSRLSFSDELGGEDGDGEAGSEFGSISQSTTKRFQEEKSKRRRQDQEAAAAALNTASSLLASPPPSHQTASPAHAAASTPSAGATSLSSAKTRRPQCVVDDDQAAWLPLGVRHQVSERQGKRPYMEDRVLYHEDWHHTGWHLFGVFDGHGGSRASCYVRDEISGILRSRILESERDMPAGVKEINEALSCCFSEVDRRFLDIARAEHLKDGTTALLGLLRNNTFHMGWVGDSRCILSRQGRYVRVSEDHKPDRADERRAVEARGGQVIFRGTYRVAGPTALAVSRAIGDILMKEPRKLVISDPEIKTIDLVPQDEFLVMASDGLFDVMEDQSVIDTVGNHLKLTHSYQGAADKLTALAIEKGSLDNVTVVIIELLWGADAIKD